MYEYNFSQTTDVYIDYLHFNLKMVNRTAQEKQTVNRFLNRCSVFANNKMCSLMQPVLS